MDSANQSTSQPEHCSNCKAPLPPTANYCQQCGQRNREVHWSFRGFIKDLFEHYLALDTKIGHTFHPFFFKPGQLTLEYINGRRAHYVQPIRLYLFSSIIFFFLLALVGNTFESRNFYTLNDSQLDLKTNNGLLQDSLLYNLPGITESKFIWSPLNSKVLVPSPLRIEAESTPLNLEISADGQAGSSIDTILRLANDLSLTPEQVVDKSNISESDLSPIERQVFIRLIRIWRTSFYDIYKLIVRNIPFMMFLLVPLFALLLKLAYLRRKDWTVLHHVVHSLHLHSLFYLLGVVVLIVLLVPAVPSLLEFLVIVSALIYLAIYCWKSLRKLFGRSFFKTTLTYIFLLATYFFLGVLALLSEIVISLYFL